MRRVGGGSESLEIQQLGKLLRSDHALQLLGIIPVSQDCRREMGAFYTAITSNAPPSLESHPVPATCSAELL